MLLDARYDSSLSCFTIASYGALQAFLAFLFLFAFAAVGVVSQYSAAPDRVAWKKKHLLHVVIVFMVVLPTFGISLFLFAFGDEKRKQLFVDGINLGSVDKVWQPNPHSG